MRRALKKELAELKKELDHAKVEQHEVLVWRSELAALTDSDSPEPEKFRLEQDLLEIGSYGDELHRLVKNLEKTYRDVFSLDRHYKSQQRRAHGLASAKTTSQSKDPSRNQSNALQPQPQPLTPRANAPSRRAEYVRLCIRCRLAPASFTGTRSTRLYCQECRPAPIAAFFAELKQRRKDLDFSISSRWPTEFAGLGMQGGAPGLGKRA